MPAYAGQPGAYTAVARVVVDNYQRTGGCRGGALAIARRGEISKGAWRGAEADPSGAVRRL